MLKKQYTDYLKFDIFMLEYKNRKYRSLCFVIFSDQLWSIWIYFTTDIANVWEQLFYQILSLGW